MSPYTEVYVVLKKKCLFLKLSSPHMVQLDTDMRASQEAGYMV